jgi:ParB family chromosome partitioning protein
MTTETTSAPATPEAAMASSLLHKQIEGIANYSGELVGGSNLKKTMGNIQAKSSDLWKVKLQDITVIEGYNPRVQDATYFAGIELLAENMKAHGYMQDKPLACFLSKIDGEDKIVLQDGHRRYAAALLAVERGAAIKEVPVVMKDRSLTQAELTVALLHSNEGKEFTTYEKAIIAKRLKSYGWTNEQIATEMRCTTAFVGELLTMAGSPAAIQELVKSGQMAVTLAVGIVKEHGDKAVEVAKSAAKNAQAKGRTKITAKDLTPHEERKANKTKNARKVAFELYTVVKKLRSEEYVEKKADDKLLETMDELIGTVEFVRPPPKPKVEKAPKAAKAPKEPKPIKTTGKKGGKPESATAFWGKMGANEQARKEGRAAAQPKAAKGRRSMQ